MEVKLFSVLDKKAGAYMQPFFSQNSSMAARAFGDAVADASCPLSKHPGDYDLYAVGGFDDQSGMLIVTPSPVFVCKALDFVISKEVKDEKNNG